MAAATSRSDYVRTIWSWTPATNAVRFVGRFCFENNKAGFCKRPLPAYLLKRHHRQILRDDEIARGPGKPLPPRRRKSPRRRRRPPSSEPESPRTTPPESPAETEEEITESEEEEIPPRRHQPPRRATLRVRLSRLARGLDQDTSSRRPPPAPPDAGRARLQESTRRREPRDRFDERTNSRRAPSPPRDAGRSRIREAIPLRGRMTLSRKARRPGLPVSRPPPPPPPAPGASAIPIPVSEPYLPPRLPPNPMDEAMDVVRDLDRLKRLQPARGPSVDIAPDVPTLDHIERQLGDLAQKINAPVARQQPDQTQKLIDYLENLTAIAQGLPASTSIEDKLDALTRLLEQSTQTQQLTALSNQVDALTQKPIPPDLSPQLNALRLAFEEQRQPDIAARLATLQNTIAAKQFALPPDFLKPVLNQMEQIANAVLQQERRVHDTLTAQGGLITRLVEQGDELRRRKDVAPMDVEASSTAPPPPPPAPSTVKSEKARQYVDGLNSHMTQLQETRRAMEVLQREFSQMITSQREMAASEKESAEKAIGQLFGAQSNLHKDMTQMMRRLPELLREGGEKLRREEKLDRDRLAQEVSTTREEFRDVKNALERVSARIDTVEPRLAERIKQERAEILERHAAIKQEPPSPAPSPAPAVRPRAPPPVAAELDALAQPLPSPRPESTLLTYPPANPTLLGPTEEEEVLERLAITHPVEAFQLKHPPSADQDFFERLRAPLQSIAEKPPHRFPTPPSRPQTPAHFQQPPIRVFEPPLGTQRPPVPESPPIRFGQTPTPPPAQSPPPPAIVEFKGVPPSQVAAVPKSVGGVSVTVNVGGPPEKTKPKKPAPEEMAVTPHGQRTHGVKEAAEDRHAAAQAKRQAARDARLAQRRPNTPIGRETPLDMLPFEPNAEPIEEDTEDEYASAMNTPVNSEPEDEEL
jgi:hypothetical protein